jgi:hypothetical protein
MDIRMKNLAIMSGVLLYAAAFSTPVFSADTMLGTGGYNTEMHRMTTMKMLDADGDHVVTQDEFTKFYEGVFDELDGDHDGSLDANEWTGKGGAKSAMLGTGGYARALRTMKMMKAMDTDGDHKVTKEEFVGFHQKLFEAMDKSGKKQLTAQEWAGKQL